MCAISKGICNNGSSFIWPGPFNRSVKQSCRSSYVMGQRSRFGVFAARSASRRKSQTSSEHTHGFDTVSACEGHAPKEAPRRIKKSSVSLRTKLQDLHRFISTDESVPTIYPSIVRLAKG